MTYNSVLFLFINSFLLLGLNAATIKLESNADLAAHDSSNMTNSLGNSTDKQLNRLNATAVILGHNSNDTLPAISTIYQNTSASTDASERETTTNILSTTNMVSPKSSKKTAADGSEPSSTPIGGPTTGQLVTKAPFSTSKKPFFSTRKIPSTVTGGKVTKPRLHVNTTTTRTSTSRTTSTTISTTTKLAKEMFVPKLEAKVRRCKCEFWVKSFQSRRVKKVNLSYLTYRTMRESIRNAVCADVYKCGSICRNYVNRYLPNGMESTRSFSSKETAGEYVCNDVNREIMGDHPSKVTLVATANGCSNSYEVKVMSHKFCCVGHFPSSKNVDCSNTYSSSMFG